MNPQHDTTRHVFIVFLTLVAGCIDAISFVNAGVFPANMTGNSVVLAVELVNGSMIHAESHAALVLAGFCCGSALAALIIKSDRAIWSRSVNLVILLAGLILIVWGFSLGDGKRAFTSQHLFTVAMAMGMQSAAALHLNFPGAGTTTAVTGTLTTMVSRIAHHLRASLIPGFHAFLPYPWFPLIIFIAYFLGALLGGLQRGFHVTIVAMFSGIFLVGVAIAAEFLSRSRSKSAKEPLI